MYFPALLRRSFAALILVLGIAGAAFPAPAQERLSVVATFTILADLVETIGGDRVAVRSIVGPGGDMHTFEPSPADARAVAEADLVIVNGLDFESWLDRLVGAAGYDGPVVVASDGIVPLGADDHDEAAEGEDGEDAHDHDESDHDHDDAEHDHDHGEFDPHAWQDVANARVYVGNIAAALGAIDPVGAPLYAANLAAYQSELDALEAEIATAVAALPNDRRLVVTSHDAFGYFAAAYGLRFIAPLGINPEAAPGAGEVAALIRQIREEGVAAVFIEALSDPRLIEQIARETGAVIGGELYSDTLTDPEGPAGTYIEMMRHNIRTLAAALGG